MTDLVRGGLMVLVGSLRPALVVLHNSWYAVFHDASANPKLFQDSFFGFLYKLSRTLLLMVALAWTYTIVLPMSSEGAHKLFPPDRFVKLLGILFNGYVVNMVRKKYLTKFAGIMRTRLYGRHEPTDLIPAHVYDRETGILVWWGQWRIIHHT